MRILLNGEAREVPEKSSVADLLESLGLAPERVAVELNQTIVRKAEHGATELSEGDSLEVVTFVGGG